MTRTVIPHLRLFGHEVLIPEDAYGASLLPVDLALAEVRFDYGGTAIAPTDDRHLFYRASGASWEAVPRDEEAEGEHLRRLEVFGLVDVHCDAAYGAAAQIGADYVVAPASEIHTLTHFGSHALPQLEEAGWQIAVDRSYPCQVVAAEPRWTASVEADDEPGWFTLELGVEVAGQRVSLLPFVLDLIHGGGNWHPASSAPPPAPVLGLPLGDHRYVPVDPARVQVITQTLLELHRVDRPPSTRVRLEAPLLGVVEQLKEAWGDNLNLGGDAALQDRSRALGQAKAAAAHADEAVQPQTLQATLRPYQREGVAWLQNLSDLGAGGVLADDMGLGKTLQTIAHLLKEKEDGTLIHPALIVAPTSLVGNWGRELARFAPSLKVMFHQGPDRHQRWVDIPDHDVVLTTYGLVRRDIELWEDIAFHTVVLDEAQAIKNSTSSVHRAVCQLQAHHRVCLSGTPLENHLEELWSMFAFLVPGLLGSRQSFRTVFRDPIVKDGDTGRLQALRERVAPYLLRRLKTEVARDLPSKTEMITSIDLAGDQRDLYEVIRLSVHEQVRTAIRDKGLPHATLDVLGALLKLRQVCCDPRLLRLEAARRVERSAKFEVLMPMVEEQLAQGRRILIFSQFTTMLQLISTGLSERRQNHALLTGATADRDRQVQRFQQGEVDVFLISLKAGGTGLNLTRADTVIHYEPWWNPAIQAQATDRAYRIGQHNPVFVYTLVAAGTVEERMMRLQDRKMALAQSILGEPGEDAAFTPSEVDRLFAPLGPASDSTPGVRVEVRRHWARPEG